MDLAPNEPENKELCDITYDGRTEMFEVETRTDLLNELVGVACSIE